MVKIVNDLESTTTYGTLFICGTPIGNLEDVTLRLLRTLKEVDFIACEDTRHTIHLLNYYEIKNKLISYHEYSPLKRDDEILALLKQGKNIALVSDAGMPVISDPGHRLIAKANNYHIPVEVIPGPSACISALVLSGLPGNPFIFAGFSPEKETARRHFFEELTKETRTVVFYEAPHRLKRCLADLTEILGEKRQISVAREITKKFQEVKQGDAREVTDYYSKREPKGEFCIVVGGYTPTIVNKNLKEIAAEVADLITTGIPKKQAIHIKAKEYGLKKSELYALFFNEE